MQFGKLNILIAVVVCAGLGPSMVLAAAAPSPSLTKAQVEILSAEQNEIDGWRTRDISKIMNAYTVDTRVITGDAPVRDGAALRTAFIRFLADPGFSLSFRSDPPIVAASGEFGIATGTYSVTFSNPNAGPSLKSQGFHLLVWRKEADGVWRIQRQLTTPSVHAGPIF